MATPGSDPFSGTSTRNVLQHIISPKLVTNGTAGYDTKVDLINVDNIYYTGSLVKANDAGSSLGTWVEEVPSLFNIITPTSSQYTIDFITNSLLKPNRFLITLNPLTEGGYTTSKNKSLSTIFHFTPTGDIVGGGSLFLDINNYITITPNPSLTDRIRVFIVTNTSSEKYRISFRRIFS